MWWSNKLFLIIVVMTATWKLPNKCKDHKYGKNVKNTMIQWFHQCERRRERGRHSLWEEGVCVCSWLCTSEREESVKRHHQQGTCIERGIEDAWWACWRSGNPVQVGFVFWKLPLLLLQCICGRVGCGCVYVGVCLVPLWEDWVGRREWCETNLTV